MSLSERLGVALIVAGGAVLLGQRALAALRERRRRPRLQTPHGCPLPPTLHAVLPPKDTNYRRVIIIGDVHGCPAELRALLDKVGYRKGVDLLLSVGDLVNKGPDSEKVLRMAAEEGIQAVRGNHDDAGALITYGAFLCWLEGKDIPKPHKCGWVAGLPERLAALLAGLPFSLQLPAYGVLIVHAGVVPGLPLEQQSLHDLTAMRDLVPAAEQRQADAAAAAVAGGAAVDALPTGSFDWAAASAAAAAAAAAAAQSSRAAAADGRAADGSDGPPAAPSAAPGARSADGGSSSSAAAAARLPPALRLVGREQPNPLGRSWASVWAGPQHIVFGHDAKRRLQLEAHATGIDTGCVYGGELTALVLPPLDDAGRPLMQRCALPPDAKEVCLATGLPAFLVQVPAAEAHSRKFQQPEQQERATRMEAAKAHTRRALEMQHLPAPVLAPTAAAAAHKKAD